MQLATLDIIIRRTLLERSLPIHYYSELLFHGASAIRELAKDSLQIINPANLPINSYGAADLPADFMDDIGVSLPVGGLLMPIPQRGDINPIRIHDTTTGAFVSHETEDENTSYGYFPGGAWFWNVNDWGEPTGRFFGANGGTSTGYKVVRERRQIQMVNISDIDSIVLLYVSNGQSIDNATQVDWRAHSTIQAYMDWKRSPNAAIKDSYEAATYYNERRLMRAEMSDLTITDIKQVFRKSYTASIKN